MREAAREEAIPPLRVGDPAEIRTPAPGPPPDPRSAPRPGTSMAVPDHPRSGSLLDRLLAWRDRLLGDPRFQRAAAAFPLTRPIALRRSRRLFDLCAGFVYSQTLLACVRLGLFELLQDGPRTTADIAHACNLPTDSADRLLGAAAALSLVVPRGAGWALGPLGAPMPGNHGLAALLEHNVLLYEDLADPLALLRAPGETRIGAYWPYARAQDPAGARESDVAGYSRLMGMSQPLIAAEVLDACDLGRFECVLDVGGGEGAFLAEAGRRHPRLRLCLFDLPAVADRARRRFQADGLSDRTFVLGGDFRTDPLPSGADLITLIRVAHDHDDAPLLDLLRRAHAALPPDGTILIAEPMATRGAETVADAYFAFYLLAMGSGRARTPRAIGRLLREAGFRRVRARRPRSPVLTSVVTARR